MPYREIHTFWIAESGRSGSSGSANARFPYWSFTKTVIAIAALKLAEDGALALDATLPGRPFSLRQLLAHTSGLPDYGQLDQYHAAVASGAMPWPRDRMLAQALRGGMLFPPGTGWSYSNIGYLFAREMIEQATGSPLGRVVDDLICRPLGLESIALVETPAQFARLHWPKAAGYHPGWVYHGCLTGTAEDAARLLHALFTGRLLRPDNLTRMRAARRIGGRIAGRPWTLCGYGLGLMSGTMGRAGRAEGHSGGGPFSVNAIYHFPQADNPMTVACFTDGTDEGVAETRAARLARLHRTRPF